jgi:hypothetical protein
MRTDYGISRPDRPASLGDVISTTQVHADRAMRSCLPDVRIPVTINSVALHAEMTGARIRRELIVIWAILAALGVPLWLCAAGIFMLVFRNRGLRKRYGDIPVRVRRPGKKRWTRGHAIWVSDVFAWRGSPAAWNEELLWVSHATPRAADPEERKKLRRLSDAPAVATLTVADGETVELAAAPEQASAFLGPFTRATATDADGRSFPGPGATAGEVGPISR